MSTAGLPSKRRKIDYADYLRVVVGPEQKEFMVHRDIITERSKFFQKAVSTRWYCEDKNKPFELPEDDPEIFGAYLQCLYDNRVDLSFSKEEGMISVLEAMRLYVLADKLGDLESMNTTIDCINQQSAKENLIPCVSTIEMVWPLLITDSPLRKLLVDFYIYVADATVTAVDRLLGLPKEMLATIIHETNTIRRWQAGVFTVEGLKQNASNGDRCRYHQHDETCPPCD
ncbi:hypothetical protein LTR86_000165 [Recurvomyces mirabilis]|nr:hypothetical protein LTR86_000165 [Recurvomyces mirabilis]